MAVRKSPEALSCPKKPWHGWNGGWRGSHTHEMLSCISCVKGPRGGPILNPVAWEMKEFQRLPGPLSSGPDPRTNLFHLLFLLARGRWAGWDEGMLQPLPPPPPLGSLLLSSRSPQGDVAVPSFFIALLSLLHNHWSLRTASPPPSLAPSTKPSPLAPSLLPFPFSPFLGLWAGLPSLWLSPLPSFLSSSTNSSLVPD